MKGDSMVAKFRGYCRPVSFVLLADQCDELCVLDVADTEAEILAALRTAVELAGYPREALRIARHLGLYLGMRDMVPRYADDVPLGEHVPAIAFDPEERLWREPAWRDPGPRPEVGASAEEWHRWESAFEQPWQPRAERPMPWSEAVRFHVDPQMRRARFRVIEGGAGGADAGSASWSGDDGGAS
jgi:hypothetical protein